MKKMLIIAALFAAGASAQTVGDKGQIDFGSQEIRGAVYDCVRDQKFDEEVVDVNDIIPDCKEVAPAATAPAAKAQAPALGATDK